MDNLFDWKTCEFVHFTPSFKMIEYKIIDKLTETSKLTFNNQ